MSTAGRIYPMTVITPLRPGLFWLARLVLWIFRRLALGDVQALGTIHFARWTVLAPRTWPRQAPDQPEERVRRHYVLFQTNFNGPWDQYIDSFALIPGIRRGMRILWGTSDGFPGPWPIRSFKRYIRYHERDVTSFHAAHPGASVLDVSNALEVARAFEELAAVDLDEHDDFDARYAALVNRVAPYLGSTGIEGLPTARHAMPREARL